MLLLSPDLNTLKIINTLFKKNQKKSFKIHKNRKNDLKNEFKIFFNFITKKKTNVLNFINQTCNVDGIIFLRTVFLRI